MKEEYGNYVQNNITEIFDSKKKEWRVVPDGPMTSDYGILSFSKLGVYIFGGYHPINMQNIHRFNEGRNSKSFRSARVQSRRSLNLMAQRTDRGRIKEDDLIDEVYLYQS